MIKWLRRKKAVTRSQCFLFVTCCLLQAAAEPLPAPVAEGWDREAPWQDFPPSEYVLGPVQRSEAILLYGLVRVLRPTSLVEFGFQTGASTRILCEATRDYPANVTSYDVALDEARAAELRGRYPSLRTVARGQETVASEARVDFAFFDGAHDFAVNKATWQRLLPLLVPHATVVVHDTGMWAAESLEGRPWLTFGRPGSLFGRKGRFHQPEEVQFVEWVVRTQRCWTRVDLGSVSAFRHGLTLLQRKRRPRIAREQ